MKNGFHTLYTQFGLMLVAVFWTSGQQTFSIRGQRVNILGFVSQIWALSLHSTEAAVIDNL